MTRRAEPLRALALACVALLAGCASRAPLVPASAPALSLAADWPARREQLLAFDAFTLTGRVAVAAGEQGFSAGLRWQQIGPQGAIMLEGPFGMGALAIETEADALRVTTGRGERFEGAAARTALEEQLGFALPLAALRYWVRGLPAPATASPGATPSDVVEELVDTAAPRLQRLQQQGWNIEYTEYQAAPFDYQPRRLVAQNGSARVRLVIERWGAAGATGLLQ
jgi:outer membrane lipoprotein LolB